jgi:anti-sigma factor ChrR (cupin superfamily)
MSTTDAAMELHADGKTLLAVAEGEAEQQPDEAMLTHIFSCEKCSASLKELRMGLSGLAVGKEPAQMADAMIEADPELMLNQLDSYDAEDRARGMIWKLAIIGALLTIGMLWLKSSAASFF